MVTSGLIVADYRPAGADDEVDIRVRYPADQRTLDALDEVRVVTNAGAIPVSHFVERLAKPRVASIERKGGQPVYSVLSDLVPGVLPAEKIPGLREAFTGPDWDPRVSVTFRGEDEDQQTAQNFLARAFVVALFIMAIILVTQFNSFYSGALILSAVILSTIGVFIGLMVTGRPFGVIMTGIGVIALAGIVVNNNIVLIDTYDRLRKTIKDPTEAILRTGAQRLRPVLLTSVTTALGLVPMAVGVNFDFVNREVTFGAPFTLWWADMAIAICFGVVFATLLTLIVTPCALMVKARRDRRKAARTGETDTDGTAQTPDLAAAAE